MKDLKSAREWFQSIRKAVSLIANRAGNQHVANIEEQLKKKAAADAETETIIKDLRSEKKNLADLHERMAKVADAALTMIRELNDGRIAKLGLENLDHYDPLTVAVSVEQKLSDDTEVKLMAYVVALRREAYVECFASIVKKERRIAEIESDMIPVDAALDHAFTDAVTFVKMNSPKGSEAWKLVNRTHRGTKKAKAAKKDEPQKPEVKPEAVSTPKAA